MITFSLHEILDAARKEAVDDEVMADILTAVLEDTAVSRKEAGLLSIMDKLFTSATAPDKTFGSVLNVFLNRRKQAMPFNYKPSFDSTVKQASEIPTTQEHIRHAIRKAENVCDCNPTEAQKKAGNYKMGHVTIQGLPITIENPAGSVRCGVAKDGKEWSTKMKHSYGYFGNTVGKDSDHVDVFLGDHPLSHMVYIVDQKDPLTDKFDEHKVMFGFHTKQEAKDAYFANYQSDWKGFMDIKSMPIGEFKKWVRTGKKTEEAVKAASGIPQYLLLAKSKLYKE